MTAASAAYLTGLGFTVGLSGALIPGPLLFYTVNESLSRGRWTGLRVILGHALVEVAVVLFLAAGLATLMSSDVFVSAVSLVGGLMLVAMGARSFRAAGESAAKTKNFSLGLVAGGTFFTAFNPSFPLWWATAGLRLILEGYARMGFLGAGLVVAGHWVADFGWYVLVSHTTAKKAEAIFRRGWYKRIKAILSTVLMGIGAYFIASA